MSWADIYSPIPAAAGIYSVWADGKLLYIGTTAKLRKRIIGHNRRKEFIDLGANEVRFLIFSGWERIKMERWLIKKHNPPLNKPIGRRYP